MKDKKFSLFQYFWQITYAHTIAYFVAGASLMHFMNYDQLWATDIMSSFYRPIDDPIIPLSTLLQIPRGILIALFILPLRKAFFEEKHGLLKLGLIIFGFSAISTIGAVWASYEGYIYLKLPLEMHLKGYPEILTYILLFIGILYVSKRFAHKRFITILSIIIMAIITSSSIMGYMILNGYIIM
jgi:hypothetical protein